MFQCQACITKLSCFLELQKSYIFLCLLLCSIFTLHMPNYVIVLLHVFNRMFLFLVAANCSFDTLGNNFLCICKGIMFLSMPVSTLYSNIIRTWFDDVFRFAVIT